MDPGMMESELPPGASPPITTDDTEVLSRRASPPTAMDDTEVLSQRASPGHREVREAAKMAPEGNASAAENMGGTTPMETDDGGPQPNTTRRPSRLRNRASNPLQRRGARTPTATSTNPEAPNPLMDTLQHASVVEEYRTLMGTVVERVQSDKSGLNEAITSLLTCFEVCDVIFLATYAKNMRAYR